MQAKHYKLTFTNGALLQRESLAVIEAYMDVRNWEEVKKMVFAENLLQARTYASLKILFRETRTRLQCLSDTELEFIYLSESATQSLMLWLAACRAYRLIREFAAEVMNDRYTSLICDLPRDTFDTFWMQKANYYPELDQITSATKTKLRQVLFLMLREAGLIDQNDHIQPCVLPSAMVSLIKQNNLAELDYFPLFRNDYPG
ncbi:DUF1819 family protein [Parathalassolituus penaei]|uniref:DUF1819 family protein n=1 Tax=Parathalassolituus penaei TaxID=2997323 RepID=A0A9X3IT66_9GAMM|nr:DUF1819 family protein [Parathalassolituus penaei]MCY0967162.1 DUF1819 family protein [Parathalassolituus penaei]